MSTRYFIGFTLPPDLNDFISTWQQKYDPLTAKRVAPHITLKGPFCLREKERILVKEIAQLVKRYKNFSVSVKNFGSFNHHYYVMFANVEISDSLGKLHQEIVQTIQPLLDPTSSRPEYNPYRPHITIANHLNEADYQQLLNELSPVKLSKIFTANQVIIFKKDGGKQYQTAHQFRLDN